jgi:archaellum component FlaC
VDAETRGAFEAMRDEMRRGFAGVERRFDAVDQRFDGVDQRFDGVDQRFDGVDRRFDGVDQRFDGVDQRFDGVDQRFNGVDQRFDGTDQKIETVRREAGVIAEDLRSRLQLVAEIVDGNAKAIERLRADMEAGFRQNEVLLRVVFRHRRRRR